MGNEVLVLPFYVEDRCVGKLKFVDQCFWPPLTPVLLFKRGCSCFSCRVWNSNQPIPLTVIYH